MISLFVIYLVGLPNCRLLGEQSKPDLKIMRHNKLSGTSKIHKKTQERPFPLISSTANLHPFYLCFFTRCLSLIIVYFNLIDLDINVILYYIYI